MITKIAGMIAVGSIQMRYCIRVIGTLGVPVPSGQNGVSSM